ncbi:hypothetical protein NIES2104_38690 [Leptolyngbya sp. NIES-2104]|nr:hypothetical protein NIES2104_38690 [Leptolyngbya sp. NIES-2104]
MSQKFEQRFSCSSILFSEVRSLSGCDFYHHSLIQKQSKNRV